ncbi:hypothetical protein PMAYCL1PPCAC_27996, partial [Pristionchus mayeri]
SHNRRTLESYRASLSIFDIFQTVVIFFLLLVTLPSACFVYFKLLIGQSLSSNYTFKLIVFNGVAELLNSVVYLFAFQLCSYPFMTGFYMFVTDRGLIRPLCMFSSESWTTSLTSLFVALNRAKTIIFLRQNGVTTLAFSMSLIVSLLLPIPMTCDVCLFSLLEYEQFPKSYHSKLP